MSEQDNGKIRGLMQLNKIGPEQCEYLVYFPEGSHHISMKVANALWKEHGWPCTPVQVWAMFERKVDVLNGTQLHAPQAQEDAQ